MSVKKLLGLEQCPLDEGEIMQRILEAQQQQVGVLEFPTRLTTVRVIIHGISPQGIMKDYEHTEHT